jgi:clan AA aspartic protease (TIGR02281 family)
MKNATPHPALCVSLIVVGTLSLSAINSNADTIYLKNGGRIVGTVESEDVDTIEVSIGFGTAKLSKNMIARIRRSTPEERDVLEQKWEERRNQLAQCEKEFALERERRFAAAAEEYRREVRERSLRGERGATAVPIRRCRSGHIEVDALVNKKATAWLIIDTGAPYTLLSKKIGTDLGLDLRDPTKKDTVEFPLCGQKITAKMMTLDSISLSDVEAKDVVAAVSLVDFEGANTQSDGLLGMSFLERFRFRFDFTTMTLSLEKIKPDA